MFTSHIFFKSSVNNFSAILAWNIPLFFFACLHSIPEFIFSLHHFIFSFKHFRFCDFPSITWLFSFPQLARSLFVILCMFYFYFNIFISASNHFLSFFLSFFLSTGVFLEFSFVTKLSFHFHKFLYLVYLFPNFFFPFFFSFFHSVLFSVSHSTFLLRFHFFPFFCLHFILSSFINFFTLLPFSWCFLYLTSYFQWAWTVPLVRYSEPFLKWTRDELKQMDQRTRKLMTMHEALHTRDDVDRLYVSRKEGGRGLASIEDSVDGSICRIEDYIEKHDQGLVTAIRNDTDNTMDNKMTITRKQK